MNKNPICIEGDMWLIPKNIERRLSAISQND